MLQNIVSSNLIPFALICGHLFVISHAIDGPCTSGLPIPAIDGIFSKGTQLKCTESGYFDLVQCVSDFCICVDPLTGYPIRSTKSGSAKTTAICGKCHVKLADYLRTKGTPEKRDDWRPQCEYKFGNFNPKQCMHEEKCFCVDPVTGKPLESSLEKDGSIKCFPNSKFDCSIGSAGKSAQPSFSIDQTTVVLKKGESSKPQLPVGLFGTLPSAHGNGGRVPPIIPVGDESCLLLKARGVHCAKQKPEVKWYFDSDTFECLAFMFNGCNGNANNFDTVNECWSKCKLPDLGGCAGQAVPAKNAKGEFVICGDKPITDSSKDSCPTGFKCTMTAFHGICCPKETQDLYYRNYRPEACATNGKMPVQIQAASVPMTLIGKKCADEFCPMATICQQREIFAHCCPVK